MPLPWKAPIALLNHATTYSDAEARALAAALQVQVSRDYYPVWGLDAVVTFYPAGTPVPPKAWQLVLLDDADQAGALGYHETTPSDSPVGKVFVRTTRLDGGSVSVTASHELLEMLGDPRVNQAAIGYDPAGNAIVYAFENCDAVESDHLGYAIDGVQVSDFVTPAWFDPAAPAGSRFDFKGYCTAPFQVLQGGYIGVLTPRGWTQFTADGETHHSSEHRYRGNRWHRRAGRRRKAATARAVERLRAKRNVNFHLAGCFRRELDELREDYAARVDDAHELMNERDRARTEVERLLSEVADLKADLAEGRRMLAASQGERLRLDREVRDARAGRDALKSEVVRLDNLRIDLGATLARERDAAREELARAGEEFDRYRATAGRAVANLVDQVHDLKRRSFFGRLLSQGRMGRDEVAG